MMNRTAIVCTLLIALATSTVASAQKTKVPPRNAGNPGMDAGLLQMGQVQKELQLSDEQKAKLLMIGMQMLQTGKRGNLEKQVNTILKSEQRQRLKEIRMQLDGVNALLNTKVSKTLKLNDDQITKLRAIQTSARIPQGAKNMSPEHYLKIIAMRKETTAKALEVLTPVQRQKFEKMQGKPVDFDLPAASPSKSKAK